jgi:hypothetical protein
MQGNSTCVVFAFCLSQQLAAIGLSRDGGSHAEARLRYTAQLPHQTSSLTLPLLAHLLVTGLARCKVLSRRQLDLLNSIDFDWSGADPLS